MESQRKNFARTSRVSLDNLSERQVIQNKAGRLRQYQEGASAVAQSLGGIEGVQKALNLSLRELAQLLWVDVSSLHRWKNQPETSPPLLWKALEWYFLLVEKHPSLYPSFWLRRDTTLEVWEQIKPHMDQWFQERLRQLWPESPQGRSSSQNRNSLKWIGVWSLSWILAVILGWGLGKIF